MALPRNCPQPCNWDDAPYGGLDVFFLETENTPQLSMNIMSLLSLHSLNGEICVQDHSHGPTSSIGALVKADANGEQRSIGTSEQHLINSYAGTAN